MKSTTHTLLEMAALNNGFDQSLGLQGDWLGFASTQAPLRLWLLAAAQGGVLAAFSMKNVALALKDHGEPVSVSLPSEACAARAVADLQALSRMVRRAFQLSNSLPDAMLQQFEKEVAGMPRTTEAERWVVQRVGQEIFRKRLLDYWENRCPVTGLGTTELLRASHIKPWADCSNDGERLDLFNGLLLAPHLDAAFDRGFVTFQDDGNLSISPLLGNGDRHRLGFDAPLKAVQLEDGHRAYLPWHREHVYKHG